MTNGEQLKILTGRQPPETQPEKKKRAEGWASRARFFRREKRMNRPADKPAAPRLTFGERLIRNSAVACALLLTLMAVRNIDAPWSNRLTQSIRSAVSMRVDWDHTIGRLSFVRALMPDTALVFLNMGEGDALARPVEGTLSHAFSADQPWQEYACEADSPVSCAQAGTVTAVGRGAGSDYIVLVSHEGGESVYGYLASAGVQEGQQVEKGQELGKSSERLYFEWREEGQSVDPADRLGG